MAHFAELDSQNVVMRVLVVANAELIDENGQESEERGIAFCKQIFGPESNWKQTSYNGNFRGCYAGAGYVYDPETDIFFPPNSPT